MLIEAHLQTMFDLFKSGKGFAFARFNDGEMRAIKTVGDVVARGDQYVTESLSNALREALVYEQENYWKGFPCSTCFPDHAKLYRESILNTDYEYQTYAVVLCNNGHWKRFISEFKNLILGRNIIWISGDDQNLDNLKSIMDISYCRTHIKLPTKNAWELYYKVFDYGLSEHFPSNSIVIFSCGPLGRVLACNWFKVRRDCVFFDAGSLFDPFTRNVWHGCHTGKLKHCPECNHNV